MNVPYRQGAYFYYSRTEQGKQYPILCRKSGSLDAAGRGHLDVNELAEGHTFMALGAYAVSDDGNLLAYTTDTTGLPRSTRSTSRICAPASCCREPRRDGRVRRLGGGQQDALLHDRGRGQAAVPALPPRARRARRRTTLVYEEKDERFDVGVGRSRSTALPVPRHRQPTTDRGALPRRRQARRRVARCVAPRRPGPASTTSIIAATSSTSARTTPAATSALVTAPVDDPRRENWKEIVAAPRRRDARGRRLLRDHYVLLEREKGLQRLRVVDLARRRRRSDVALPGAGLLRRPRPPTPSSTRGRSATRYQSLMTPRSVFDYDMDTKTSDAAQAAAGARRVRPRRSTPPSASSRRRADGTKVPISLVYRKDVAARRHAPDAALRATARTGIPHARDLLLEPPEPARPRRRLRPRAHPRRRRDGQAVARRRAA